MDNKSSSQSGFTLVELAIVIVIIGLLVGGVLQGQELIKQSRLQTTVKDFQSFSIATTAFYEKYKAVPGDMPNASTYMNGALNGDNSYKIQGIERYYYWQHLSLSNLIKGGYNGQQSNPPIIGLNLPAGAFSGSCYFMEWIGANIFGRTTNFQSIMLGKWNSSNSQCNIAILSPLDAQTIDKKLDDGVAYNGVFTGSDGVNGLPANASCSSYWGNSSPVDYRVANEGELCGVGLEIRIP